MGKTPRRARTPLATAVAAVAAAAARPLLKRRVYCLRPGGAATAFAEKGTSVVGGEVWGGLKRPEGSGVEKGE